MNGALALMESLRAAGVTVCFGNPGTSELHLVAALEQVPGITGVLCPAEGVATGAADGFGRMRRFPAATLLHQGPGLANGLANLHNARRACAPVVNVVGASATGHKALDAPLECDVEGLARPMSSWVRTSASAADAGPDAQAAVRAACHPPGGVATLVVPADVSWSPGGVVPGTAPPAPPGRHSAEGIERAARVLGTGGCTTLLLGGASLDGSGPAAADRIAQATGARVLVEAFPARLRHGLGAPPIGQLSGDPFEARDQLAGTRHLVLAGAADPVAAFAYPGAPGRLTGLDCGITRLCADDEDLVAALEDLADLLAAGTRARPRRPLAGRPVRHPPATPLTAATVADTLACLMPETAILIDEANSSGGPLAAATGHAAPHDVLSVSGFAIGHALPLAAGAALACPDRPVLCLESDGSAMYTLSALWTQARENLDVTTVLFNNRGYSTLRNESRRMLVEAADVLSSRLFDLAKPDLDFVALCGGMGVPAARAGSTGELAGLLADALAEPGPHVIEVSLPGS